MPKRRVSGWPRGEASRRRFKTDEGWQRLIALMDEAYKDYENGLVALRKRVVDEMRCKLKEGGVLDHPHERSTPRSALARRRR